MTPIFNTHLNNHYEIILRNPRKGYQEWMLFVSSLTMKMHILFVFDLVDG